MPVKKSNRISINLSEKALQYLQALGYIDGKKKVNKKMNLSRFYTELTIDYVNNLKPNSQIEIFRDRLAKLNKKREKIDLEVCEVGKKIRKLNEG